MRYCPADYGGDGRGQRRVALVLEVVDHLPRLSAEPHRAEHRTEGNQTDAVRQPESRLLTAPGSDEELLTDDIAADIEILADELDMVVVNPGLKKTLRYIKGDMKRGKLF